MKLLTSTFAGRGFGEVPPGQALHFLEVFSGHLAACTYTHTRLCMCRICISVLIDKCVDVYGEFEAYDEFCLLLTLGMPSFFLVPLSLFSASPQELRAKASTSYMMEP